MPSHVHLRTSALPCFRDFCPTCPMPPDFAPRLRAFAEVIVRIGLNLQAGQRLLVAEPYELQGVARSAEVIVDAVRVAAVGAGCAPEDIEIIWGDSHQLRDFAARKNWREYTRLVAKNAATMQQYVTNGDALLFLQGSQPTLLDGIAVEQAAELRRIGREHFGPVAQTLMNSATNWTVGPAPSPEWADAVYGDLPQPLRLGALWSEVFEACRIGVVPTSDHDLTTSALAAWRTHLAGLRQTRDQLNAQRHQTLRYQSDGTDLTVTLPAGHVWCTAQLTTRAGVEFVANLPTEEVFTLPDRDSTHGTVRVARPVNFGGAEISGIELEFKAGRVIAASARHNAPLLEELLATDEGAVQLGEVALVPNSTSLGRSRRLFRQALLDENAANHIALGEAYGFCLRGPDRGAVNHSLIHVDLPLDARATLD